jgi:phage terminase small subunit
MKMANADLTDKQTRFVDAYVGAANCNGTKAATLAGYSPRSAYSQAGELLANPKIRAAIKERLDLFAMTAEEVLMRLSAHARGTLADFFDITEDGPVLNLQKAEAAGRLDLVEELTFTEHGPRVRLYRAQNALQLLGKRHKLFTEKVEHSADPDAPPVLVLKGVSFDDL